MADGKKISRVKQRAIQQIAFLRKPPVMEGYFEWAFIDLMGIIRDNGFTYEELGFTEKEFQDFEKEAKKRSRKRFAEAKERSKKWKKNI